MPPRTFLLALGAMLAACSFPDIEFGDATTTSSSTGDPTSSSTTVSSTTGSTTQGGGGASTSSSSSDTSSSTGGGGSGSTGACIAGEEDGDGDSVWSKACGGNDCGDEDPTVPQPDYSAEPIAGALAATFEPYDRNCNMMVEKDPAQLFPPGGFNQCSGNCAASALKGYSPDASVCGQSGQYYVCNKLIVECSLSAAMNGPEPLRCR
jgi:hypothetical protein